MKFLLVLVGLLVATGSAHAAPPSSEQKVEFKRVCMGISLLLMMYCLWLIFKGSYDQTVINWDSTSAVMEVSMGWFYASGMALSVLGGLIILSDLWRLVTGKIDDDNLVLMQESEEAPHAGNDAGSSAATHTQR